MPAGCVRRGDRLGRTRIAVDLTRAHLLYGEWLRRAPRLDAREQLRFAYERFSGFGMDAFAERARIELLATGEHARKRTVDTSSSSRRRTRRSRVSSRGATHQSRDRRSTVRQPEYGRVPPPEGVLEARREVTRASRGASRRAVGQHRVNRPTEPSPSPAKSPRWKPVCPGCPPACGLGNVRCLGLYVETTCPLDRRAGSSREHRTARHDGIGDVHEFAMGAARLIAEDREAACSSMSWRSIRIPFARSVTALRPNAPSRAWYSAKRRRTMSIALCISCGSCPFAM